MAAAGHVVVKSTHLFVEVHPRRRTSAPRRADDAGISSPPHRAEDGAPARQAQAHRVGDGHQAPEDRHRPGRRTGRRRRRGGPARWPRTRTSSPPLRRAEDGQQADDGGAGPGRRTGPRTGTGAEDPHQRAAVGPRRGHQLGAPARRTSSPPRRRAGPRDGHQAEGRGTSPRTGTRPEDGPSGRDGHQGRRDAHRPRRRHPAEDPQRADDGHSARPAHRAEDPRQAEDPHRDRTAGGHQDQSSGPVRRPHDGRFAVGHARMCRITWWLAEWACQGSGRPMPGIDLPSSGASRLRAACLSKEIRVGMTRRQPC